MTTMTGLVPVERVATKSHFPANEFCRFSSILNVFSFCSLLLFKIQKSFICRFLFKIFDFLLYTSLGDLYILNPPKCYMSTQFQEEIVTHPFLFTNSLNYTHSDLFFTAIRATFERSIILIKRFPCQN